MVEISEIENKVNKSIRLLLKNDSFLLENNVNERTISHKFAEYLQQEFKEWHVDCEYNRNFDKPKELKLPKNGINWDDTEAKTVFPDIIVHIRNTDNNLLVIEVKKSNSSVDEIIDKTKLIAFTKDPYSYKFGLFIKFYVGKDFKKNVFPSMRWFKNGKEL